MDKEKHGKNCLKCHHRHQDNGNCTAVGGFCTAVPAAHCPLIPELLDRLKRVEAKRQEYQIRAAKADLERAKIQAFVVTEYCPHGEKEQSLLWDAGKDGYEIYCPACGEKIMLCSVCDEFDTCDWRVDSGCKKRKKG